MVKRIAANRIDTPRCQYVDSMVEIRDGVVTAITPLADLQAEPAATVFVNGTLSGDGEPLYVGYKGKILLNNETIIQL